MPRLTAPVVASGRFGTTQQPELLVDELVLRPWRAADIGPLVVAYDDADIQRWHVRSMSRSEAAEWIRSANAAWTQESAAHWAVTADGRLLGRVSLRTINLDEGVATIAYWVVPAGRGRGIAPRALTAASAWALDDVGLHRLELEHSTHNQASCRVATKAGYLYEGTKSSQALHVDGWHDMHLHARVAGAAPV